MTVARIDNKPMMEASSHEVIRSWVVSGNREVKLLKSGNSLVCKLFPGSMAEGSGVIGNDALCLRSEQVIDVIPMNSWFYENGEGAEGDCVELCKTCDRANLMLINQRLCVIFENTQGILEAIDKWTLGDKEVSLFYHKRNGFRYRVLNKTFNREVTHPLTFPREMEASLNAENQLQKRLEYVFACGIESVGEQNVVFSRRTFPANFEFKGADSLLYGRNAFYNSERIYMGVSQKEFAYPEALSRSHYQWNTEVPGGLLSKIANVVKWVFSIALFPLVLIYKLVHLITRAMVVPAIMHSSQTAANFRSALPLTGEFKYKRLMVEMDGYNIDAMIVGTPSTLNNGRWILSSNGNAELYESTVADPNFQQMLGSLKANALVFNYPGVGGSSGTANKEAMVKAYQALLNMLEERVGAKEIIGYGRSIGGGVQGEALKSHPLKEGIKYVFVKDRTFTTLSATASAITRRIYGWALRRLGWEMSSPESSKQLEAPEIIIQTAQVEASELLHNSSKLIDDGVIPARVSLAKNLLEDADCPKENKRFIGMQGDHNSPLDIGFLVGQIEEMLQR